MAAKKKQAKAKWSVVLFGAFVFVASGLSVITAYYAGAVHQLGVADSSNMTTTNLTHR
jgi:Na+-driven multidrug efflux pump